MIATLRRKAAILVDPREFVRFFASGITAASGDLAVVWMLRHTLSYEAALLCGIAAGFAISFLMTRLFAFRPATGTATGTALARFMVVYLFGVTVNMSVAVTTGKHVLPLWLPEDYAKMLGAFLGAGTMMVTSYLGHRFFTYRTAPRRA